MPNALVRPGLSGLAQVNGRNALNWNRKMFFDQYYVAHMGFRLDMEILCKTLKVVSRGQEVNFSLGPALLASPEPRKDNAAPYSEQLKWQKA